jgi:hypothetical protein
MTVSLDESLVARVKATKTINLGLQKYLENNLIKRSQILLFLIKKKAPCSTIFKSKSIVEKKVNQYSPNKLKVYNS